jgi:hypothetical protein
MRYKSKWSGLAIAGEAYPDGPQIHKSEPGIFEALGSCSGFVDRPLSRLLDH